jgi:hypothetical protein
MSQYVPLLKYLQAGGRDTFRLTNDEIKGNRLWRLMKRAIEFGIIGRKMYDL